MKQDNFKDTIILLAMLTALSACVSGAPRLTSEQLTRLSKITIHKEGEIPAEKFQPLSKISAADCSGAPAGGRVWGDAEKAIEILRVKAAALNADAVINVSCGAVPFLNNCWAAQRCTGDAVVFQ